MGILLIEMSDELFGERLKRLRKQMGISQRALADRIGMDRPNLRKIEVGRIPNPTESTRRRLAEGLGLSFEEFSERTKDRFPDGEPTQFETDLNEVVGRYYPVERAILEEQLPLAMLREIRRLRIERAALAGLEYEEELDDAAQLRLVRESLEGMSVQEREKLWNRLLELAAMFSLFVDPPRMRPATDEEYVERYLSRPAV